MIQATVFRLPDDLLERLDAAADADGGRSRNSLVWSTLDKAFPSNTAVGSEPVGSEPITAPAEAAGSRTTGAVEPAASPVAAQLELHASHLRRHLAVKDAQAEQQRQAKESILKQLEE
jgi:hypothetical protein